MHYPLIECIPNFSEARNQDVIEKIRSAVAHLQGVSIIDQHSDMDHNRTVITMIGSPRAIEEAAYLMVKQAAELIDLQIHRGQHPRIGATDVLPFIPVRDASMLQCIEIARRVGKRIGSELQIPVYLYEEAAVKEDNRNLENIRRGQYEGLQKEIQTNPSRSPDFGPSLLGPAGAIAVGARYPLVAFNIFLNSSDPEIAKTIALAVRNSSGGLRYVKALGMLVNGMAQVSMNLTNFEQSSLPQVVEMVRREAMRFGVTIRQCELVGLVPEKALINAAAWYLQLNDFKMDQILESKVNPALFSSLADSVSKENVTMEQLATSDDLHAEISAIAHVAETAIALITASARSITQSSLSDETRARMISLIERVDAHRVDLEAEKNKLLSAWQLTSIQQRAPSNDPEQITVALVERDQTRRKALDIHYSFAAHCAEIISLAQLVGENGESPNWNPLCTAAKFAKNAADCCFVLIEQGARKVNDDQYKKQLSRSLLAERTESERLLGSITAHQADVR